MKTMKMKTQSDNAMQSMKTQSDRNIGMFVNPKSAKRHQNKSYDYENNKKVGKTQKNQ